MGSEIKGAAVAGTVQRIKEKYGKEKYQQILKMLSEEDQDLFNKRFLPSFWYSLDAFTRFLEAEVKLIYSGNKKRLQDGSREIVRAQLKGIYKLFVKLGSPEYIVKKIGSVNSSYFQGITLHSETVQGKFIGRYTGFGPQNEIISDVIIGFYLEALEISGAKNIRAEFTVPISEGKDFAEIQVIWN